MILIFIGKHTCNLLINICLIKQYKDQIISILTSNSIIH